MNCNRTTTTASRRRRRRRRRRPAKTRSTFYRGVSDDCIVFFRNVFFFFPRRFFSISEIEFARLAEQLNSRLQVDPAHESVDLDNLFAFLSDVQSGRTADDVGDRMKEIVSDFDEVIVCRT